VGSEERPQVEAVAHDEVLDDGRVEREHPHPQPGGEEGHPSRGDGTPQRVVDQDRRDGIEEPVGLGCAHAFGDEPVVRV